MASRTGMAAGRLRPDDGIVVIASGDASAREFEPRAVSCIRDALARTQGTSRVFSPDEAFRAALARLAEGKGLEDDAALREHITTLGLHHAVFVSVERSDTRREWTAAPIGGYGGGGVFVATDHAVSYAVNGSVMDLSSGLTIGSVRSGTEAKSSAFSLLPFFIVWLPRWIPEDKICLELGRQVAAVLGE